MTTPSELQALLRFLSQDAKLPLAEAMGKIKELQKADLTSPELMSQAKLEQLQCVFADEKVAKQIFNAAKRSNKKRGTTDHDASPSKKKRKVPGQDDLATSLEDSIRLPEASMDEAEISETVLITNRAPLVLAFGVTLLKYTMPEQPLSSRLSLAQAVVSMNSRSKAVSLGLESGKSADEEGWGVGQPGVRVMGRDVKTMKRFGWKAQGSKEDDQGLEQGQDEEDKPALWGLDLEALKKGSDRTLNNGTGVGLATDLPVHTPQSARNYLLKAFDSTRDQKKESNSKKRQGSVSSLRERNLSLLLGALDMLFKSWSTVVDAAELDRKAWSWYIQVRPNVDNGVAGWGGKGEVKLNDILKLKK